MHKKLKVVGRIALALAGIVLCGYLSVLAINWNDQPPSADAIRLAQTLAAPLPPVAEADNGFVYLMGFGAAEGKDPVRLGSQRIAWAHQVIKDPDALLPAAFPLGEQLPIAAPGSAQAALAVMCRAPTPACSAALDQDAARVARSLADGALLLERYTALVARPLWRNTLPLDKRLPFPALAGSINGQRHMMLQAWQEAGKGNVASVARLLAADCAFWRRAYAAPDSLVVKMVATIGLKWHFAWGNMILRRLPAQLAWQAIPPQWHTPVSLEERAMLRVLAIEYQFVSQDLGELRGELASSAGIASHMLMSVAFSPFMQKQDTRNRYASTVVAVSDTLNVPYPRYAAAFRQASTYAERAQAATDDWSLYNWPGKLILSAGDFDFTRYAVAVADVEGVRRVALLGAQLRRDGVAAAAVRTQLAASPLRDPYDGRPFLWDQASASIVFVGLEPAPRGRHALIY